MAYGLKVFDADGNITINTTDHTARLVYANTFAGSASGSVYIPEADGTVPFVLPIPGPNATGNITLITTITSGGTLSWEPSKDYYNNIDSEETTILVYVCDERG